MKKITILAALLITLVSCSKQDDTIEPNTIDHLISNEWVLTEVISNETSIVSNDTIHNFMSNGSLKIDSRLADYKREGNNITVIDGTIDKVTNYQVLNVTEKELHLQDNEVNYLFIAR